MNVLSQISDGLTLRSKTHKNSYISFLVKILIFLLPGILLGYYIDFTIKQLQDKKVFGNHVAVYITFQTLVSITVMYYILKLNHKYTIEIQGSLPGLYFVAFFFNMQTNYLSNWQNILDLDRS